MGDFSLLELPVSFKLTPRRPEINQDPQAMLCMNLSSWTSEKEQWFPSFSQKTPGCI